MNLKGFAYRRLLVTAMLVIVLVSTFFAGSIVGFAARPVLAATTPPPEFSLFWEAWDIVINNFVDRNKIDFTKMTYGAIQGMLDSLGDQGHTVFFPPEVAKQQENALDGSFEGIGAYVSLEGGQFTITAPIHGSPAEAAGVLAGDIVLQVDGVEISGLPEYEIIGKVRGPAGTKVVLTIVHAGEIDPVEITITRGRIEIASVTWARIPGTTLAYLQITQFEANTADETRAALRAIRDEAQKGQPITGLVLDLRNNGGGYLFEATQVASQFLPEGQVILHERNAEGKVTDHNSSGDGLLRDLPMIVLVNEGTASAGEILAGALQENDRARLVGAITLGTGTVLTPFNLSDGSLIRLGVTNWLTPKMNLIKNQGVKPDVAIKQKPSIKMVNADTLTASDQSKSFATDDRQFNSALLLIRLKMLAGKPG